MLSVMGYGLWVMGYGLWVMGIITEFTEMSWNDCVFEHTKEHLRCYGKRTGFSVYVCRKEHFPL